MRAHDRDKEAQRSPWQSGAAALCNVGVGVSGTYAGIAAASWWQKAGPRQRLLAFGVATGYSGMLAYYVNSYTAGQAEQVRQEYERRGTVVKPTAANKTESTKSTKLTRESLAGAKIVLVLDRPGWPRKSNEHMRKVIDALRHAASDDQVRGLCADMDNLGNQDFVSSLADMQELRATILRFRRWKRDAVLTVAYSSTGYGTLGYYIASAFDQVYLHPDAVLTFTGLAEQQFFLQQLLQRWNVQHQSLHRKEYKDIYRGLMNSGYTKHHREAVHSWLSSCMQQIVDGVAETRGLPPDQVSKTINLLPLTTSEAAAAGLINSGRHKLDAMHSIQHFISVPVDKIGQDEAVECQRGCKKSGTPAAGSAGASMVTNKSVSDEAGRPGQLVTAATPSTRSSNAMPDLVPFKLLSAAEKAALLQQFKASLPDQKELRA